MHIIVSGLIVPETWRPVDIGKAMADERADASWRLIRPWPRDVHGRPARRPDKLPSWDTFFYNDSATYYKVPEDYGRITCRVMHGSWR